MTKTVTSEDGAEVTNIRYTVRKNNTVTYQQPKNSHEHPRPQKPLSYSQHQRHHSSSAKFCGPTWQTLLIGTIGDLFWNLFKYAMWQKSTSND